MRNKVVAHYQDGRLIKGTTLNVDPTRPTCHVKTVDDQQAEVVLSELKALFFVKDLDGNPSYQEKKQPQADDARARGSQKIDLHFNDGELIAGFSNNYSSTRSLFFVLPVDPWSNNIRILVNRAAVVKVETPNDPAKLQIH